MNKETKELIKQFHSIARKRWIKSISKSFGSIGLTFEKELNKTPDSMYFPDYLGIEIKCTSRYSRYPLFLFTSAFDGPTFPEINRIIEKYGYFDKDFTDKTSEEFKKVKKKLVKQAKTFGNEITISIVFDRNDLLGYKDSPIDCGLDTFLKLFQTRIVYGWAFSH